jgi:hypothetical protein
MKKFIAWFGLILCTSGLAASAQNNSTRFTGAKWSVQVVSSGFVDIYPRADNQLGVSFTEPQSNTYGIVLSVRSELQRTNSIVWEASTNGESCMWAKVTCAEPGITNTSCSTFFKAFQGAGFLSLNLGGVKGLYREATPKGAEKKFVVCFSFGDEVRAKLLKSGITVSISNVFDIPAFELDLPAKVIAQNDDLK